MVFQPLERAKQDWHVFANQTLAYNRTHTSILTRARAVLFQLAEMHREKQTESAIANILNIP